MLLELLERRLGYIGRGRGKVESKVDRNQTRRLGMDAGATRNRERERERDDGIKFQHCVAGCVYTPCKI
jgi:hypothetical protein